MAKTVLTPFSRRGMTLLEVLISVFCLSVGLLALAMLIPAGGFTLLATGKADRSGACGRAGLCEVQVRHMLDPFQRRLDSPGNPSQLVQMWLQIAGPGMAGAGDRNMQVYPEFNLNVDCGILSLQLGRPELLEAVCIDPYGIALAANRYNVPTPADPDYSVAKMRTFPAAGDEDTDGALDTDWDRDGQADQGGFLLTMPRVTLRAGAVVGNPSSVPPATQPVGPLVDPNQPRSLPMNLEQAERVFLWRDDVSFTTPEQSADGRPEAVLDRGVPQSEGAYSWMVTMCSDPAELPDPPRVWGWLRGQGWATVGRSIAQPERHRFTVSIVIFFKRDPIVASSLADTEGLAKSGERSALAARFLGAGNIAYGGGSVILDRQVDVREGDWMMLCGTVPRVLTSTPPTVVPRKIFHWYRVAKAGEVKVDTDYNLASNGRLVTTVTLVGPDWPLVNSDGTFRNDDGNGLPAAQAVILKGVVGVYTRTVELNENLVW